MQFKALTRSGVDASTASFHRGKGGRDKVEVVSIEVHAGLEASGEAAVGSTIILYEYHYDGRVEYLCTVCRSLDCLHRTSVKMCACARQRLPHNWKAGVLVSEARCVAK